MKTSTALIALAGIVSFNTQGAKATCYGSGDKWPSFGGRDEALQFVSDACRNNNGMFTGYFDPGQTKRMCPVSTIYPYISEGFEVQNLNTRDGFDLDDTDCYNRLKNEILGCDQGGESIVAGWRFR